MGTIKNIVFDLGGVIINLDMQRTIKAFEKLGIENFSSTYNQLTQTELFDRFDKGLISPEDFFSELKHQFKLEQKENELIQAWNLMLLDFPESRLLKLMEIKSGYRTFLLSNTNETHVQAFESLLKQEYKVNDLSPYFEKVYYSCRLGMRKPDKEIFDYVLNENKLEPEETLFIDDTIIHVEGARKCGIQAELLPKGEDVFELLQEKGISV